jgi:hypothetical protein
MKWITRENAKVDRMACPWLIRRFIDVDAEFLFVPVDQVMTVAAREGATPYDMPGVKFGHGPGQCSFESILLHHELTSNEALVKLGRIVHAADVPADDSVAAEGAGLRAIALGFSLLHGNDDRRKLDLEMPMYDALYAWCVQEVGATQEVRS